MNTHVTGGSAPDWGDLGDDLVVEPMPQSRLMEVLNACGMEMCQCEPDINIPPELEALLEEQRRAKLEPVFFETLEEGDAVVYAKPSPLRIVASFAAAAMFAAVQVAIGNGITKAHASYIAAVADNPAYTDFMGKAVEYQARKVTQSSWFASRDNDLALVYLESAIMMHEARPADFNLADIGGISCIPGEGELPMGSAEACHGVLPSRRKKSENGPLGLDKP